MGRNWPVRCTLAYPCFWSFLIHNESKRKKLHAAVMMSPELTHAVVAKSISASYSGFTRVSSPRPPKELTVLFRSSTLMSAYSGDNLPFRLDSREVEGYEQLRPMKSGSA